MEAAVVRGDVKYLAAILPDDFRFTHGDGWTSGGEPIRVDTKETWLAAVAKKPYLTRDLGPVAVELHGDIALTYGREVDWLKNVRAAGGARLHIGRALLALGAPVDLPREAGLVRMPLAPKVILPIIGGDDFIELPVLAESIFTSWGAHFAS